MRTEHWYWWAAYNDEGIYTVGPCNTREEVINKATQEFVPDTEGKLVIWLCEATHEAVRIADWIDLDSLLDTAENNLSQSSHTASGIEDDRIFDCTVDQEADLISRIRTVCNQWQKDHGLVFQTKTFSDVRNEQIVVTHLALEK